jgi:toxin FitB
LIVLDTNVISEPLKPVPAKEVLQWLAIQAPETLYMTTISIAEMLSGVEKLPKGKRRDALHGALIDEVFPLFAGRILSFDESAAEAFSLVIAGANAKGNPISFADAAIAGIARAHGFAVATRNVRDYKGADVELIDPWAL